MPGRNLVSAEELARHVEEPEWRVVDCRHSLTDRAAGRKMYDDGHIPGAVFAHVDEDLSSPVTPTSGRHPMPEPARFRRWCRRAGISESTMVVAYDDDGGAFAGRLWWLMRDYGHERVRLLDGGLAAWTRTGLGLADEAPEHPPGDFTGEPGHMPRASAGDLASNGVRVIDVRAAARYRGETEPLDTRAGHIPGARNVPYSRNLDDEGRFLPPAALGRIYQDVVGDRDVDGVVAYCGSGVTACQAILSIEEAGLGTARLYPGSWSHWIRDDARPVRTGSTP